MSVVIGPDGPRNAREEEEWLMQRSRERAEADAYYEAYAEAYWAEQEVLYADHCDLELDKAEHELGAWLAEHPDIELAAWLADQPEMQTTRAV